MARHAELADEEDIQGDAQGVGDLERDRDSAARERQNDDVRTIGVVGELLGEDSPRLGSVMEWLGYRAPRNRRLAAGLGRFGDVFDDLARLLLVARLRRQVAEGDDADEPLVAVHDE